MRTQHCKLLIVALAGLVIAGSADAAPRHKRQVAAANPAESAFWGGLVPMENGVPVIMKGYHPPKVSPEDRQPQQRADRPVKIPRGSSSLVDIPPVNPSPRAGPTPQDILRQGQAVQPYNPPPINSFGDRATNAIHDFPLQRGLGNNPNDLQSFIRQRANQ